MTVVKALNNQLKKLYNPLQAISTTESNNSLIIDSKQKLMNHGSQNENVSVTVFSLILLYFPCSSFYSN